MISIDAVKPFHDVVENDLIWDKRERLSERERKYRKREREREKEKDER